MADPYSDKRRHTLEQASTRIIQEYVPGRQVTIAHVIANPDKPLCQRVGINEAEAIGLMLPFLRSCQQTHRPSYLR